MKSLQERFFEKVMPEPNTGCWLWSNSVNPKGYGFFWSGEGMKLAHRISYQYHIGIIPDGLFVCHKCDVPSCVNPEHLFLGTDTDNRNDKLMKHRQAFGERCSLLKESQVLEIIERFKKGENYTQIAPIYGIAPKTVYSIVYGQSWKHLGASLLYKRKHYKTIKSELVKVKGGNRSQNIQ